ncbi:MAG: M3 family oligoendopeptidase, partial [Anaerolineales bacterium]|nr:M3 family oligoendopeptidase [Anaerolineales bacterium]
MFDTLPTDARTVMDWGWEQFKPFYDDLLAREITAVSAATWLADWTRLDNLVSEAYTRLHLSHDQDTTNKEAEQRYFAFLETIVPPLQTADQALKDKLLQSRQAVEDGSISGMAIPLQRMRAEADLFREENIPLSIELNKMSARYQKIVGSQTVMWEGEERPLPQLRPYFNDPDRAVREQTWRAAQERRLIDRAALNDLWQEMLPIRCQVAANADCSDYRDYSWRAYHRFDYTPKDAQTFQEAIAAVCVPAATRIYERHRQRLGLTTLRPWDLNDGEWSRPADPPGLSPLRPYRDAAEFLNKSVALFQQVDERLGNAFQTMVNEHLLDVENRAGKAPGGYCTYFATAKRPFIFMNAVGLHDDVQTMMHEAGHAFHAFAHANLPYHPQQYVPMEFNEVASMSMELLAAPYLGANGNGHETSFYTSAEAARARIEHLEQAILFWPYMAVVDAFQHWVYTHPQIASDPAACDATWLALWQRYLPGVDWSG